MLSPFSAVIADVVGRVAVRHLPHQLALVEVHGGYDTVRRLDDRQPLRTRPAEAASATATGCCCARSGTGSCSARRGRRTASTFSCTRTAPAGSAATLRRIRRAAKTRTFRDAELAALRTR